jgi:serine/threonine protein kinase
MQTKKNNSLAQSPTSNAGGATYRIVHEIATGGTSICSVLYKMDGTITMPQRLIQKKLKILSKPYLSLFSHEYEVGHILNSEYIARYLSYSAKEKSLYIEYIDGLTFGEFLATSEGREYFQGNDAYHHIHDFCVQVLSGMQQIHAHRLCHCDLKPNNIMIRQGSDHRAVLIDLGMAITQGLSLLIGTTESSKAPEMKLGQKCEINILCDIFMFGQVMQQVAASCPIYEPVCKLCTQQNPADRFQSVAQVLKAIEDIYSEKVNDDFNRLLSVSSQKSKFTIKDSILYYDSQYVCDVTYLSFVKNNQEYLKLITDRQNVQVELDESISMDEHHHDRLKQQFYELNLKIFMLETDIIELALDIYDIRNAIEEATYKKIYQLFTEGHISEAKDLIDKNALIDDLHVQQNINIKNSSHTNNLVKKMLLYVSICQHDWHDKDRYKQTGPLLKKIIDILSTINYDKIQMADILCRYGLSLCRNHKNKAAIHQYEEANILYQELEIRMPLKFQKNIAECHRLIAESLSKTKSYELAIIEYHKQIDTLFTLYQETNNGFLLYDISYSYRSILFLYVKIGKIEEAIHFMNGVIEETIDKDDYIDILLDAYLCLSDFYGRYKHDYEKAIFYIQKRRPFQKKAEKKRTYHSQYQEFIDDQRIGSIYFTAENYDEAERYFQLSLQEEKEKKLFTKPFNTERLIATVKIKRKDFSAAEQIYKDICYRPDVNEMTSHGLSYIEDLGKLASLNIQCKHYKEAKESCLNALNHLDNSTFYVTQGRIDDLRTKLMSELETLNHLL